MVASSKQLDNSASVAESSLGNSMIALLTSGVAGILIALIQSNGPWKFILISGVVLFAIFIVVFFIREIHGIQQRIFLILTLLMCTGAPLALALSQTKTPTTVENPGYYIQIFTYEDTNDDGLQDGNEMKVSEIQVVSRSARRGVNKDNYTSPETGVLLSFDNFKDPISIGVCGVSQEHIIPSDAPNTASTAYQISIGISKKVFESCKSTQ